VTIRGLQYELENAELTNRFPLGVSNAFAGKPAEISVKDGILILVYPRTKNV
jgi:thiamine pyrophosphokinase